MLQTRTRSTTDPPLRRPFSFAASGGAACAASEGALLARQAGRRATARGGADLSCASTSSFAAPGARRNAALRQCAVSSTSAFTPRFSFAASAAQAADSRRAGGRESRLQHLIRNRFYDPHTGRFTAEDPLAHEVDLNYFRYVGNNPMLWVDPFGLFQDWAYPPCKPGGVGIPQGPFPPPPDCPCRMSFDDCMKNCRGASNPWWLGAATSANAGAGIVSHTARRVCAPLAAAGAGWGIGTTLGCAIACILDPCIATGTW